MLDAVTLDQLRTLIAAADEGSFSGAGRKLRRAQSVISKTLANLEGQFGVTLFDRTRRRPVLTPHGQVLLAHARTVVGDVDLLKAQARRMAGGLEPELSIVVEVMFPMATLTAAVTAFHGAFPLTPLRLYVEALGAVIQPVVDGRCTLAISGELAFVPAQFSKELLLQVPLVQVTSPQHPLAAYGRNSGEDRRRRRATQRFCDADARGISHRIPTGDCRTVVHRSAQAGIGGGTDSRHSGQEICHQKEVSRTFYLTLTSQRSKASCATLRASSGFIRQTPSCWIEKSAPVKVTLSRRCSTARSTTGRIGFM
jgi:DNA-binding transcriptional LysR family regulator